MMRYVLVCAAAAAVGACSVTNPPVAAPQGQVDISQMLAGRTAGSPKACLSDYRSGDMVGIEGGTLVFRDGDTLWVNKLRGGCTGVVGGNYALVTKSLGGFGICSGDIAQLVDLRSGIMAGSCVIGDFVPYRRP